MRYLALIFLLSLPCVAQTQGFLPYAIDGTTSHLESGSCGAFCVNTPESLNIGDLVFVGVSAEDQGPCGGGGSNPPWTFTSGNGNSFTRLTAQNTTIGGKVYAQSAYFVTTVSGVDQLTVTGPASSGCIGSMVYGRFGNVSGTVDGSLQTCVSSGVASIDSCTASYTTATNGSLLIVFGSSNHGTGGTVPTLKNANGVSADYNSNNGGNSILGYLSTGAFGSYSPSLYTLGGNSTQQVLVQAIAFKPSGVAIADSKFPDAASGVAYAAQLHCIGGTGTLSYTLASGSLPTGITLTASGANAGLVSGTSTAVGSYSPGFTCTDSGTSTTSATRTLPFNLGAAFNTISIRGWQQLSSIGPGPNSAIFTTSAACGDVIVVLPLGMDSAGAFIGLQNLSGVNNSWQTSPSYTIQRLPAISANHAGAFPVVVIGPATQTGQVTLFTKNNQDSASFLNSLVVDVASGQSVVDVNSATQVANAGSGSNSVSYTPLVANELLLTGASSESNSLSDSMSLNSPFTTLFAATNTYNAMVGGYDQVTGTSTVTATGNITTTALQEMMASELVGIRPALPPTNCLAVNSEKIRRPIW